MLHWIGANLSTILISIFLIAIVILISLSLIRQKRQGRSSCGGSCAHCGAQGHSRHPKRQCHAHMDRQRLLLCLSFFVCPFFRILAAFRRRQADP